MDQTTGTLSHQFWGKVSLGDGGCWDWVGGHTANGYGYWHGIGAHRVAYQTLVAPIPTGLTLDHLCRNRSCVNPAHLEPVPQGENTRRGTGPVAVNARRAACVHGHALTPENVYVRPDGRGRQCRTCIRDAYWQKKLAAS